MKHKVLHVIPNLHYGGGATQLSLLAAGLPSERFQTRVAVLGPDGPLVPALGASGVGVATLGWSRLLDLQPFLRLRQELRCFRPDIVHVWHPPALRVMSFLRGVERGERKPYALLVSRPLTRTSSELEEKLDRWLLNRADRVAVSGPSEAARCQRRGLPADRLCRIPPGSAPGSNPLRTRAALLQRLSPGLPEAARCIACVGPLEPHKGFKDAIWTFDILRYLYNDLHLLLIGSGSDVARLDGFIHALGVQDRVHLVGNTANIPELLSLAEVVWVPSRTGGGVNVALEAMQQGRPVIATRLAELAEVVAEGETGILVKPGDVAALARQTHMLLEDKARRERLGQAGREHVSCHFAAEAMVRGYTQLYDALIGTATLGRACVAAPA